MAGIILVLMGIFRLGSVIKFMPYAVVAMLANTITARGISSMISVIKFIVALYIAVIIVFIIHLVMVN